MASHMQRAHAHVPYYFVKTPEVQASHADAHSAVESSDEKVFLLEQAKDLDGPSSPHQHWQSHSNFQK